VRITGLDVLGFAAGGVAVAFSGFVLFHSTLGGLAMVGGGALALALPFLREDAGATLLGVAGWVAVIALLSAGVGGFLVGFGVFDDPDVRWNAQGERYDLPENRSAVVVTGSVTNAGDATAAEVVVTATLVDADGDALAEDSRRLAPLAPDTTQLFHFRFAGETLRRYDGVDVSVRASE